MVGNQPQPRRVYLDHNAAAPIRDEVRRFLAGILADAGPGNPASIHQEGRRTAGHLEDARAAVAAAFGVPPLKVIFTSGGTEANALALSGCLRGANGAIVAVCPLSHPSVVETAAEETRRLGGRLLRLPCGPDGRLDPKEVGMVVAAWRPALVSINLASHELGVVQDAPALAAAVRNAAPETVLHVDAVQALGKVPVDGLARIADRVTISSHKVGGPPGAGALVIRRPDRLAPLWAGGAQERGLRPGSVSWLTVAGFGRAVSLAVRDLPAARARLAAAHARLLDRLAALPAVTVFGNQRHHTHNTVLLGAEGCEGELLVMALDLEGFAVSMGAACSAGIQREVVSLAALGYPPEVARSAIRVSFGPDIRHEDLDRFADVLERVIPRVRRAASGRTERDATMQDAEVAP